MKRFLGLLGMAALLLVAQAAVANTLVSTINGYYDQDGYDTPSLHISNTTGFDFTNVSLTLTGYQGLNNGFTQSITLSDISAGSTFVYVWGGSTTPGNLFAYDYDDEWGNCATATGTTCTLAGYTNPVCVVGGGLCAPVGNFYVTFTAMWNGQSIYSQFSPDPNLAGAGNAAGVFVGWEGLDPNGVSESIYDSHSNGGPNGVLANIYVGTPPPVGAPEPSSLVLLGTGLVGVGSKVWKRFIG